MSTAKITAMVAFTVLLDVPISRLMTMECASPNEIEICIVFFILLNIVFGGRSKTKCT